ncbi:MAG: hypothetical protein EXX96DRAFT_577192, partial [Benjaminiella poitrasii]
MLKKQTSYITISKQQQHTQQQSNALLYDKVRQDLFKIPTKDAKARTVPSITTILLLQTQACIVKRLAQLSPNSSLFIIQRWILLIALVLLDNMARILDIEREMTDMIPDKPILVSPIPTPTPSSTSTATTTATIVSRQKASRTSKTTKPGHGRSLSNNLLDYQTHKKQTLPQQQQHKLRRITGQR